MCSLPLVYVPADRDHISRQPVRICFLSEFELQFLGLSILTLLTIYSSNISLSSLYFRLLDFEIYYTIWMSAWDRRQWRNLSRLSLTSLRTHLSNCSFPVGTQSKFGVHITTAILPVGQRSCPYIQLREQWCKRTSNYTFTHPYILHKLLWELRVYPRI